MNVRCGAADAATAKPANWTHVTTQIGRLFAEAFVLILSDVGHWLFQYCKSVCSTFERGLSRLPNPQTPKALRGQNRQESGH
jgi:hypothetical protein